MLFSCFKLVCSRLVFLWCVLFYVGLNLCVKNLSAQEHKEDARFFLIIANNHSRNQALKTLQYADDDGALYYRLFKPYATRITLLSQFDNDTQKKHHDLNGLIDTPTQTHIEQTIANYESEMKTLESQGQKSVFYFIYIGHGDTDNSGQAFLHLLDGSLYREKLFEIFKKTSAHLVHVILDACQAYALVSGRGIEKNSEQDTLLFKEFLSKNDLNEYPHVGILLAYNQQQQTHEWSRLQAGVFSHVLRSGLYGVADINLDGVVEYSEIAAFVEAAFVTLKQSTETIQLFARAPMIDKRSALVNMKQAKQTQTFILDSNLLGHFSLETAQQVRLADFNKAQSQTVILQFYNDDKVFLNTWDERAAEIKKDNPLVYCDAQCFKPLTLKSRGRALDYAFTQHLFSIAYDTHFYHGYMTQQSHLSAVEFDTANWGQSLHAQMNKNKRPQLDFKLGYRGGVHPLLADKTEHGLSIESTLIFKPYPIGISLSLDFTRPTSVVRGISSFDHVSVYPGFVFQYPLHQRVEMSLLAEIGYSALFAKINNQTIADNTILATRARINIGVHVIYGLWVQAQAAVAGFLITIDNKEYFKVRPEWGFLMSWKF